MSRPYHALHAAHGAEELTLPDTDERLRSFFTMCMERPEFQAAKSEREQVHYCAKWRADAPFRVSHQQLADFFQVGKSTITYHLSRPFDVWEGCEAGDIGRPSLFTAEQRGEILDFIESRFAMKMPPSYEDLRDFTQERWGLVPHIGTLRSIIGEWDAVKTVDGEPLEDSRLYSSREEIESYFEEIAEVVHNGQIPAAFVVNVDESGFDQFVDARQTRRIVPARYEFNRIPVGVTRTEKRATLIAAICADGMALRPMIVLQRETIEKELLLRGYTPDKVRLCRSDTGFVNSTLFLEWGKRCFFPDMRQRRAQLDYDGPILLIMDGFGCHQSEAFLELAEEENVVCRFIPPHTSDQLQPLDLGVFANQKRWQTNITVDADLNRQTKQVIKICDSYRMATTPKNVVSAFRRAGFTTHWDDTTATLMVDVDIRCATALRDGDDEMIPIDRQEKQRVRI